MIKTVFFDVGETLINETRLWSGWAAYLGVSVSAFVAALEEVIAEGQHHQRVFDRFRPNFDLKAAQRERAARDDVDLFAVADLYPDAVPCLRALRERGYTIGIAGNQPADAERILNELGVAVDIVTSSASLGAEKPSPAFFEKLAKLAGVAVSEIAYVGDRLDNDVLPALDIGMVSVFLQRGPWGQAHAKRPEARLADLWLTNLSELPDALDGFALKPAE
jgi:HAD superfamily hydrolase (TIGR01549 family)